MIPFFFFLKIVIYLFGWLQSFWGLPWWLSGKESAKQEMWVQPVGWGGSPGGGNGNPLKYSCLGNSMDRGAWRATVPGVAKESDTIQRVNNSNQSGVHLLVSNLKLPSSTMSRGKGGVGLSFWEVYQIALYTLPHHYASPLSCIPSFPWWITVWACPLRLREGLRSWSLFLTNEKWGDIGRLLYLGGP